VITSIGLDEEVKNDYLCSALKEELGDMV